MGSQNLLLILLGFVIVGVAVYVGMGYFSQKAASSARDAMMTELGTIANDALAFYARPKSMDGGNKSFTGYKANANWRWVTPTTAPRDYKGAFLLATGNGTYSVLSVAATYIVLEGVGDPVGKDNTFPIRVRAQVEPNRKGNKIYWTIMN